MSAVKTLPVAVIGAGIIGTAIACELTRRGHAVVLVEREEPGKGASFGNMASIAVTEFLPSSRPAIWAQMPGWLLDPEGPVRLDPAYLPRMIPWAWRFLLASLPGRVRALADAGAVLARRALGDMQQMLARAGLDDHLSSTGCLCLYASDDEYRRDADHIALLQDQGLPFQPLRGPEAVALEPALSPTLARAVLLPDNRSVRDPYRLVVALAEQAQASGRCTMITGRVVGFDHQEGGVNAIRLADGRSLAVSATVLCAGAHTGELARLLSEPIPLETERGYHTQIMAPDIALHHSLIWPAHAFMVTPTAGGIRVGGTVEMAGLDKPPDYRRAKVLVRHAQRALPRLACAEASEWMGHRPAFPDTIPLLSRSAKHQGVFYATGHGHLGLTCSATSALLMADLIDGRPPVVDPAPYSITRFRSLF